MSKNPPPYPNPPPGWTPAQTYEPGMQPQQGSAIIVTVPSGPATSVGPNPVRITCPSCHADILTKMKHEATTKTHLMAVCLCLFICWPCVCLPYCMDSCQNANHYCPNCNAFIGTYHS